MKFLQIGVWILLVLSPLIGCSGYRERVRELENYQPSAFYQSIARPRQADKRPPSELSDKEFRAQIAKLEEKKSAWERTLQEGEWKTAFYAPDPERLPSLLPAQQDSSAAQRVLETPFSLADLEILAFLRNPAIKAAEKNFRAALESYSEVANLDEIIRQYTAFTEALRPGIGPMVGGEPMETKFPFPGVLALKGEVAHQGVVAAWETLEIARRRVLTAARKSYWDLVFLRKSGEITGQMVSLLNQLDAVAATRYETGKTSFQDLIRVRIERDKSEEDLRTIGEQQRNTEVRVLALLNLSPMIQMAPPLPSEPPRTLPEVKTIYPVALERKQEVRRLKANVGRIERMIEMAETMIFPPYSLNLSFFEDEAINQVGTGRGEEPFSTSISASRGTGLPKTPWYGSNDAYLRETRQRLQALKEELRRMQDETHLRVREAWFQLDRTLREEALYHHRVVNLSQAALEVSLRGYETGKVSFADAIASYTTWLQAHLTLERRRSDLGIYRAELEEAVGGPLEERR